MKSLLRTPGGRAMMVRVLGWYLGFALRTTRWTLDGEEFLARHIGGTPAIFTFWHEHLPMMSTLAVMARRLPDYRARSLHTLVSHHRDGRFIGELVRRFGIEPVLGSTSRGGASGLRSMAKLLEKGALIAITPDGPRGPRRKAAPGVAQLAALTGVPVVPCAAYTSRAIRLGTWDRMRVPLPFGRAVMVCGPALQVDRNDWQAAVPQIAAAMSQASDRARRLCGS